MAADSLLDRLRDRGTLEGGCSAPEPGCWIDYDRKGVRLADHSEIYPAFRSPDDESPQAQAADQAAWRRIKPAVLVKVTWAEAAAPGASLSPALRDELDVLRRTERTETSSWRQFSDERGGYPHRRRFQSDEAHEAAAAEWDEAWRKHRNVLHDVWDRRKSAIERALPLTVDEEPVDLLELLAHEPEPARQATVGKTAAALQAGALQASPAGSRSASPPCEGLFTLPTPDQAIAR